MHRAKELNRLLHGGLAGSLLRDVALDNLRNATLFVDHALRLLRPFDVVVEQRNLCPLPRKQDGCGTPVANFTCEASMGLQRRE